MIEPQLVWLLDVDVPQSIGFNWSVRRHSLGKGADRLTILSGPGVELHLLDFCELRLLDEKRGLAHSLEIVSAGKYTVVIGSTALLSVSDRSMGYVGLNRTLTEDSGFYSWGWYACEFGLLGIYESGVIRLSGEGLLLWHKHKKWDDILVSVGARSVTFEGFDGKRYSLDLA
jgi:hypothetical protein